MITEDKVTKFFCMADVFCKLFDAMICEFGIKIYKFDVTPKTVIIFICSPPTY